MPAVRAIGTTGRTWEIRAETHPVSASAASTATKVTGALDGPWISTIAIQGSTAPAAKAALTANVSRSGARGRRDAVLRLSMGCQRIVGRQLHRDLPGEAGERPRDK